MPRVASEAMKPIRTWSARKLAKRARLPIHARHPKAIDSRRRLRLGRPRPLNRAQLQKTKSARSQSPAVQAIAALVTVDRKSTRLNSSHLVISYAVFCLKKKKKLNNEQ